MSVSFAWSPFLIRRSGACLRKVKIKKRRSEIAFAGREVPVSKNLATSVSLVSSSDALLSSIAIDRVFYIKQAVCQFVREENNKLI
jgi:hypothetical protein